MLLQGEAECSTGHEVPGPAAEAFAGRFGRDPRGEEGSFLYPRVTPRTARARHGEPELRGRVVMRDGKWLEQQPPSTITPRTPDGR